MTSAHAALQPVPITFVSREIHPELLGPISGE